MQFNWEKTEAFIEACTLIWTDDGNWYLGSLLADICTKNNKDIRDSCPATRSWSQGREYCRIVSGRANQVLVCGKCFLMLNRNKSLRLNKHSVCTTGDDNRHWESFLRFQEHAYALPQQYLDPAWHCLKRQIWQLTDDLKEKSRLLKDAGQREKRAKTTCNDLLEQLEDSYLLSAELAAKFDLYKGMSKLKRTKSLNIFIVAKCILVQSQLWIGANDSQQCHFYCMCNFYLSLLCVVLPLSDIPVELFSRPGSEYTPEQRNFALTLNLYSPKTYEYVRKQLNLPAPRTLRRYAPNFLAHSVFIYEKRVGLVSVGWAVCLKFFLNLLHMAREPPHRTRNPHKNGGHVGKQGQRWSWDLQAVSSPMDFSLILQATVWPREGWFSDAVWWTGILDVGEKVQQHPCTGWSKSRFLTLFCYNSAMQSCITK